jgi:acetyltransferase-like isoleucine patch superfamily enzyme
MRIFALNSFKEKLISGDMISLLESLTQEALSSIYGRLLHGHLSKKGKITGPIGNLKAHPIARLWIEEGGSLDLANGVLQLGTDLSPCRHAAGNRREGITICHNAKLAIKGKVSFFKGAEIYLKKNSNVVIGENSFLSNRTSLVATESIEIGANCAISWNVSVIDSHMHSLNGIRHSSPVFIGNNVWIGIGATILPGVTIGDGSVIGAHSLVTRSIPSGVLAAGNPARIIKDNITWEL